MSVFIIKESAVKIAVAFLIYLEVICSSTQAQTIGSNQYSSASPTQARGNALVRLAANVNLEAMEAVEIQQSINSAYEDLKPKLTPSGNRLYFTRIFHPGNTIGVNDPEDIWYADLDKISGLWSEPVHVGGVLNNAGPNYINNISASGDTIVLGNQYLKKGKMRAGLSYSVNQNGVWSAPTSIDIANDYNMSQHSSSYVDIKTGVIIRSVQRAESIGERDLFVSFWDGEKATEPINMGPVINTQLDESSPFLAADHKTMYFASEGHNGYGGFDIYVTKRLDDTWMNWSTPENLGPAVNGALDDEFFTVSHCARYAFFSKQVSVHDTNLFRISLDDLFKERQQEEQSDMKKSSVASL